MEADHRQPPTGAQHLQYLTEKLLQVIQFSINEDANRLKTACRRVFALFLSWIRLSGGLAFCRMVHWICA
ncbi:hypothetical protein QQ73_09170, partial [Candidatus Endoriftia persephone str. Guaymas]|nr:hypothetical protein [Candidatus Endoriftia persephone str. Guaymas]